MTSEQPEWQQEFERSIAAIDARYHPERFPKTVDTQRAYQQEFDQLDMSLGHHLDFAEQLARTAFDDAYRSQELRRLDQQERSAWPDARTSDDLFAMRQAQLHARQDLDASNPNPSYRQSEHYKTELQNFVQQQADRRDWITDRINEATQVLEDRFGFNERPPAQAERASLQRDVEDRMAQLREDRERED